MDGQEPGASGPEAVGRSLTRTCRARQGWNLQPPHFALVNEREKPRGAAHAWGAAAPKRASSGGT